METDNGRRRGVIENGSVPRSGGGGFGIDRSEVVLEVPKRFWINPDTVAASEIGKVCSGLKPWIAVVLFLIREKRKYIDVLPEETNSTIFCASQDEELAELRGSQLLSTTLSVKDYIKNEFQELEEEVISHNKRLFPNPITLSDLIWAFGILRSRAFSQPTFCIEHDQ